MEEFDYEGFQEMLVAYLPQAENIKVKIKEIKLKEEKIFFLVIKTVLCIVLIQGTILLKESNTCYNSEVYLWSLDIS